ncbi:MAG: HD domain-containing phosphohydrolase [Clostridia bacterium]|jgi:putative nucleotidyltransferase with HDIG domain
MRKQEQEELKKYKIIGLDDEIGIIDSLSVILKRCDYDFAGFTDPEEALEAIKNEHFDILILDYLMGRTRGDIFVKDVRKFNTGIYILLLTGYKDIAPPLETIKTLDIQGYCEKSNKFDQLILLIESGIKSISQIRTINVLNEGLNNAYEELQNRYLEIIEALRLSVDAKDTYTRGHSDRVSFYAKKVGEALKLSDQEIENLRIAGIFHDLGKIGTIDDILFKTDTLTNDEFEEIKKHTLKGSNILSAMLMFKDVVPIVKYHHERIDGKGYPEGISGDDIPLLSRILSVVDAFDAMTTTRRYREKLEIEQAKSQLKSGMGTQFDSRITKVFLELIENFDDILNEMKEKGIE